MLEIIIGIVALVVGVLFGSKLFGKSRGSNTTELEHSEKVRRDAAMEKVVEAHENDIRAIRDEAKEARSRPVSDVLVDLINNGEIAR